LFLWLNKPRINVNAFGTSMEKLSINNFAGLREMSLDISPVTGLIGPQASGKSVIAKLLYFFREIGSRVPAAITDGLGTSQYKAECCKRFTRYFPLGSLGTSDFEVSYVTKNERIRLAFSTEEAAPEGSLLLEWSDFFPAAIEKFSERKQKLFAALGEAEKEALNRVQRTVREEYDEEAVKALGPWSKFEQIFIPAGRAFFSQFRATVFSRLESGEALDPFMVAFGSLLEQSKNVLEARGFFGSEEPLSPEQTSTFDALRTTFKEILRADLGRAEKNDFLHFQDGRRVRLAQASSGQQEALPLLLLMARFVSLRHGRGRAVYIEEPEAHLFPSTQKLMVEFMARVFRARKSEMCLFITTHSPYILASVNNLLQAGKLYINAPRKTAGRLKKIIPPSHTLRPGEVGFYNLQDGRATSILDPETGLVDASLIDQVSNDIAIQFDKLLAEADEKP
jgi:hypothetical protein